MIYSAFGLTVSTSSAVPGLEPLATAPAADVQIWLDGRWPDIDALRESLCYTGDFENGATPEVRVWSVAGQYFRFRYYDGVQFVVDRAGTEVWASWPATSTLEDAATYLLGPVLGFLLRLRGVVCLHASAVAVDDRAVLLAGPPEAGKSTAAAAFWRIGHAILTDDVAPIVDVAGLPHVQPAYPQLRLWPEAVEDFYGSAEALPKLTPTWEKRALDLRAGHGGFQLQRLPLAGIYVLEDRSSGRDAVIESLSGRASILALLANSYTGYLLDPPMRANELAFLTRIAARVPVRRLVRSADRPQRLCERILDDCEALGCTASPITAR